MPLPEASHSSLKGNVKLGRARTCGDDMVLLSVRKASSAFGDH